MSNLAKTPILLIVVLSSSVFFAQTTSLKIINSIDTLTINVSRDSLAIDTTMQDTLVVNANIDSLTVENSAIDTTLYRSIMLYRYSIRYNLKKPYNKDIFKFKYDSFKEKMKEPWIGDILKDVFFR